MMDGEDWQPMGDARMEHPDEGTIHAWLDGALDDATEQALAAHVASCRACAERVAEARGLIGGASRIVGALDDVPSTASPAWGQPPAAVSATRAGSGSVWRTLRVTPARAAIAATLLVALGVALTYERSALDTEAPRMDTSPAASERAQAANMAAGAAPDAVLDSAIARNLAAAQPPRAVKPAAGPALPVPEPSSAGAASLNDAAASTRVAAGRAAVQAQRESAAGTSPDRLAANAPAAAKDAARDEAVVAARRADRAATPAIGAMAMPAPARAIPQARARVVTPMLECYRVESANGTAATWGPVPLPLVVALESSGQARVLTPAGQSTDATASVTRAGGDSLFFRLQRTGYEGTLALGAAGESRAGVMRSRQTTAESVSLAVPVVARRMRCGG